jgi:hypothetical protein
MMTWQRERFLGVNTPAKRMLLFDKQKNASFCMGRNFGSSRMRFAAWNPMLFDRERPRGRHTGLSFASPAVMQCSKSGLEMPAIRLIVLLKLPMCSSHRSAR